MRWYSPRDYVEEEEQNDQGETVVKGTLSPRMKIPGNMWVEAWETARVTPARRQKRLFDDTKEAEKVGGTALLKPQLLKHSLDINTEIFLSVFSLLLLNPNIST